jgi:septal ring factor EnvC (AmiA/AmiB activator)
VSVRTGEGKKGGIKLKKLMMLFLLVSFMCFGEEKTEPKKSYEVIQREEIDFLKTQLIRSNNKIDDLSKKIEELEDKEENNLGLTYNVDQIYQNSVQYYDSALTDTKWLIKIVGGIISALLIIFTALVGIFKINSDKKLEKERNEVRSEGEKLKQEITKKIEKILEFQRNTRYAYDNMSERIERIEIKLKNKKN